VRLVGDAEFAALADRMRDTARRVHALFNEIVDRPAAGDRREKA
jgi:hypothetical protein